MKKLAIFIYRFMEQIDGENYIRIIPYKLAEKIKILALKII